LGRVVSPEKAIITLRNPSDHAQDFTVNLANLLELPAGSATVLVAHSPWKSDVASTTLTLSAGEPRRFHLQPFQVQTLEFVPK
jgi:hypothetical protein